MRAPVRALLLAAALGAAVARAQAPPGPAAPAPETPGPFRFDEASGRCVDAAGRQGHNPASREALVRTAQAECADFGGRGHNLTYLQLARANLRGARLTGVRWYLGALTDSDLTGADLSGTTGQMDYSGSRLRGARLAGADLTYADLRGADLDGADLRGARFSRHTSLPFDHDTARRRGMVFVPEP
jgi:uncharacterized protein YjbI with pentapeptide repeats